MSTVAIIQARLGSRRFPGKMMAPLCGTAVLEWTVNRTRMASTLDEVVVATSNLAEDAPIADWCRSVGVPVFRGSSDDVLDRYYRCAVQRSASRVVRITGDCPLIDPALIDAVTRLSLESPDVDYATNLVPLTYPEGMSVEVVTIRVFEIAWRESTLPSHREHVTPFIRFQSDRFKHAVLRSKRDLAHMRLTVDYREDLDGIAQIVGILTKRHLLPGFSLDDIVRIWDENPTIRAVLGSRQRDLALQDIAREEGRDIA